MTDIEIARRITPKPIGEVAKTAGIAPEELSAYGTLKAKVSRAAFSRVRGERDGKLVLVTAITPTPAGEGKTTVSIGLADGLRRLGVSAMLALREPSMGPVFGVKGGATGGGHAQVMPMEEINLHFTGDLHAIAAANNLLAAMVDNHIFQGNALNIKEVVWRRCMDMNDRQLRSIQSGRGSKYDGRPREDGFDITAASEVMAALCLSDDIEDLARNLSRVIVGYDEGGRPVRAHALGAAGAMTALLRDAMLPNLVQTLEGTPALIHGGPFANIAHGCSSVVATKLARKLADYTVTEAGFGADLGAEKFLDIKCRKAGIWPDACVLVATVRALKYHGGAERTALNTPDVAALERGLENLSAHVENLRDNFKLPTVVAINRFPADTEEELALLREHCERLGVQPVLTEVWEKGGAGAQELAQAVMEATLLGDGGPHHLYALDMPLMDKISAIATRIYGAADVAFTDRAVSQIEALTAMGMGGAPVCMAKTQMSLSDDPKKKGRPQGFTLTVREVRASAGAGFVVALTGTIVTMPGLPPKPAAEGIFVDGDGNVEGIF
jgi:formate--tetrahydrofolate ligase